MKGAPLSLGLERSWIADYFIGTRPMVALLTPAEGTTIPSATSIGTISPEQFSKSRRLLRKRRIHPSR
jgi:hypothetical protein